MSRRKEKSSWFCVIVDNNLDTINKLSEMEKIELICLPVFNDLFLEFRIVVVFVLFIKVLYNPLFTIRLTKINYPLEWNKEIECVCWYNREMNCVMCHNYLWKLCQTSIQYSSNRKNFLWTVLIMDGHDVLK